ncbi:hypothetical protein Dimus_015792 [Dionaea muscipula]
MKPFQRLLYFIVMKNVVPRFRKRDTTSFMDLIYMDHLLTRRLVNLPRVMLRHMAYVISVPSHELPYGDWLIRVFKAYHVPLDDKQGEEPKSYDFFEETFLTIRRDEDEAPAENVQNEEVTNEGQNNQSDFDWVQVEEEEELQGEEQAEKEAEGTNTGSGEKYYDAVDEERPDDVDVWVSYMAAPAPTVLETPVQPSVQQKKKTDSGVDPTGPSSSMLDFDLLHLQAGFARALQRNTRFQEHQSLRKPSLDYIDHP